MITTLAKLGATQRITILLDYESGNVTATLMFAKRDEDNHLEVKPIQIVGTVAEVEAHLASPEFSASVGKIEGLVSDFAAAEADLKKQVEEKKAEAAKKKDEPAPAPKLKKPEKAKPAEPSKAVTPIAAKADAPVPSLTPAWKPKVDAASKVVGAEPATVPAAPDTTVAAEPSDDELAGMFEESQQP